MHLKSKLITEGCHVNLWQFNKFKVLPWSKRKNRLHFYWSFFHSHWKSLLGILLFYIKKKLLFNQKQLNICSLLHKGEYHHLNMSCILVIVVSIFIVGLFVFLGFYYLTSKFVSFCFKIIYYTPWQDRSEWYGAESGNI